MVVVALRALAVIPSGAGSSEVAGGLPTLNGLRLVYLAGESDVRVVHVKLTVKGGVEKPRSFPRES